ncbi:histidine--tRNA ligase [Buchnera aphidicola]|uniref:histidine--tRNA ligase n=1 Tax=Buchnera aphidicola TaxID=9 RepID=UPI003464D2F2
MNNSIQSIKGMHDLIPEEVFIWNKIENLFRKVLLNYSYSEIRFPILERTDLFKKTIGKNTEVIEKEMYSFNDKNGQNITLRPEGTIGCVRSVIQNGLIHHQRQKLWYYGPMFRYERPQKGRYRQFYQLGIETFGFKESNIELELIMLINRCWNMLNISNYLKLEINLIGSIESRKKYQKLLTKFLIEHKSILDEDSLRRLYVNPIRILDSKNPNIQKLLLHAPVLISCIDTISKNNFNNLCNSMDLLNIKYVINPRLVRGLDYYNNTVFEWKTDLLGSQNTICAGGRYDMLVKKLGGNFTPAIGLAVGMDRLVLLINSLPYVQKNIKHTDVYIFFSTEKIKLFVISFLEKIRDIIKNVKFFLELDPINIKKILKNLNKYSARIVLYFEEEEIKKKCIKMYDLEKKTYKYLSKSDVINIFKCIFTKIYN